jgi:hypothetical protein
MVATHAKNDTLSKGDIKWYDFVLFVLIASACFFLFGQDDLRTTAEQSFLLLDGHVTDFYSACHDWNGAYAAGYLPSTYIVFALWNLPLKLMGMTPDYFGASTLWMLLWYKLLPTIFYAASAALIYKIAREDFGFGPKKAKITLYAYISAPVAFYSQFIFSQYDIFTVFFVLLGMHFYFHKSGGNMRHLLFLLMFGIAATFKYQALMFLAVLMVLRQKNLMKLIGSTALALLPLLFEVAFAWLFDRTSYIAGIANFKPLDYVGMAGLNVGFASINLMPALVCGIVAWAYLTKPEDRDEWISYAMFFCCGICFVFFTFMPWHPQWLLIGVPFLLLSTMINRNYDVFLWLDTAYILFFYIFFVNKFNWNVDQETLRSMVLAPLLKNRIVGTSKTMADFYYYTNTDMCYSIMSVIMLLNFAFKHPRFRMERLGEPFVARNQLSGSLPVGHILRTRFLAGALLFVIPAVMCIPSMMQQPRNLWSRIADYALESESVDLHSKKDSLVQTVTLTGEYVSKVVVAIDKNPGGSALNLRVLTADGKTVLGKATNATAFDAASDVTFPFPTAIPIESGKQYKLAFSVDAHGGEPVSIRSIETPTNDYQLKAVTQDYTKDDLFVNGLVKPGYYIDADILGE